MRRLLQLVVVMIVVTFFTSLLTWAPAGDPVNNDCPVRDAQEQPRSTTQTRPRQDVPCGTRLVRQLRHRDLGHYYDGTDKWSRDLEGRVKDAVPRSLVS